MELFVDDAATGGHPLHVTGTDHATCAGGIAVFHFAVVDDGDGLEAPVRVGAHAPAMAAVGGEGCGGGIVHQQEGTALIGALPVVEHAVHGKAVAHPVASGLVAHVDHGLGGARSMGSGCRHRHALQKGRLHGPNIGANDAGHKRGIPHQTVSRNGTMRLPPGDHRFPCSFLHAALATPPSRPGPMGGLAGPPCAPSPRSSSGWQALRPTPPSGPSPAKEHTHQMKPMAR